MCFTPVLFVKKNIPKYNSKFSFIELVDFGSELILVSRKLS